MENHEKCQICGSIENLQKHHLVPQVKCHNKYKSVKEDESNHIWICDECHRTLHAYYDNNYLRDNMNTLEKILSDEKFMKYVEWRRKHMDFRSNSTKMSRNRR